MTLAKNPHVVAPKAPHTHTIIFLHGRGSHGAEFQSEFFESLASDERFLLDIFPGYKWVFPTAARRYTETEQEEIQQWFDMESVREPRLRAEEQLEGLRESVQFVVEIVKKEAEEVGGYEKVFLGGISQGCATAVVALLTIEKKMAGFIGMSGWAPFPSPSSEASSNQDFVQWVQEKVRLRNSKFEGAAMGPVLLEHAEDDEVVPVENGFGLCEGLRGLGMKVEWQEYVDGGHWINEPRGIDDMVRFIKRYE
jgi:lysophospholipase-2